MCTGRRQVRRRYPHRRLSIAVCACPTPWAQCSTTSARCRSLNRPGRPTRRTGRAPTSRDALIPAVVSSQYPADTRPLDWPIRIHVCDDPVARIAISSVHEEITARAAHGRANRATRWAAVDRGGLPTARNGQRERPGGIGGRRERRGARLPRGVESDRRVRECRASCVVEQTTREGNRHDRIGGDSGSGYRAAASLRRAGRERRGVATRKRRDHCGDGRADSRS
jgi:hypothetical protein